MVKPCTRCGITEVDARTGRHAPGVLRMLASFRADPALGGAVTFGQNAIVVGGLDGSLTAGAPLRPTYRRH
jgi:uncharacterized protein YcbX